MNYNVELHVSTQTFRGPIYTGVPYIVSIYQISLIQYIINGTPHTSEKTLRENMIHGLTGAYSVNNLEERKKRGKRRGEIGKNVNDFPIS